MVARSDFRLFPTGGSEGNECFSLRPAASGPQREKFQALSGIRKDPCVNSA